MTGIAVRPARSDEYDAVGELTVAAYATYGDVSPDYLEVLRDARRRAEAAELLVAVDGTDALVGTVTLVPPGAPPEWRETSPEDAATIRTLAVAPTARRQGLGALLTRVCIERSRERGWPRICLVSGTWMTAAHALYENLGFTRDTTLDWEPRPGLLLLGYSLPLDPPPNSARDTNALSTVPRATS
ncbi:MAG TPA: GNAT family N-acetyltransferase [Mycobacteriales bacterium]|nr:GNAT family N-acetyltransferase [Mycobacteriales bacterium]